MPEKISNNGRIIATRFPKARTVLYGYADIQRTIDLLIEESEAAEALEAPGDIMLQKIRDRLRKTIAETIESERAELVRVQSLIASVHNDKYSEVLRLRYIDMKGFDQIVRDMFGGRPDYGDRRDEYLRQLNRLHRSALERVEMILTEQEEITC